MTAVLPDICSMHTNYLMSVALKTGLQYADAEDAVQDLWLTLQRGREAPVSDEQGNVRAWLAVRLRWEIARKRRNANRQKRGGQAEHVELEPDMAVCVDDPSRLLELRWLRDQLNFVGANDEALLPDQDAPQSGRARVAMCRLKKRLQPLLAHLRS